MFFFFVAVINTTEKRNICELNNGDERHCKEIDDDSFYNDMVNRMMCNTNVRGRKRKAGSTVKKTKRLKKGKVKK